MTDYNIVKIDLTDRIFREGKPSYEYTLDVLSWCHIHCKGEVVPFGWSSLIKDDRWEYMMAFQEKADAVYFKLIWGGDDFDNDQSK